MDLTNWQTFNIKITDLNIKFIQMKSIFVFNKKLIYSIEYHVYLELKHQK